MINISVPNNPHKLRMAFMGTGKKALQQLLFFSFRQKMITVNMTGHGGHNTRASEYI